MPCRWNTLFFSGLRSSHPFGELFGALPSYDWWHTLLIGSGLTTRSSSHSEIKEPSVIYLSTNAKTLAHWLPENFSVSLPSSKSSVVGTYPVEYSGAPSTS